MIQSEVEFLDHAQRENKRKKGGKVSKKKNISNSVTK